MSASRAKILFVCESNSAASQLAEGLAKRIFGINAEIQSAGLNPTRINPYAVRALKEVSIDISKSKAKSLLEIPTEFLHTLDFLVAICSDREYVDIVRAVRSVSDQVPIVKWDTPILAAHRRSDDSSVKSREKLRRFRVARDSLIRRLNRFSLINKIGTSGPWPESSS